MVVGLVIPTSSQVVPLVGDRNSHSDLDHIMR